MRISCMSREKVEGEEVEVGVGVGVGLGGGVSSAICLDVQGKDVVGINYG